MKKSLTIFVLLALTLCASGQSYRVINQFYFNPALYNPAYVAHSGYFEVYTYHRQQWLGIDDAPSYTGLSVQYPTRKRLNLGAGFTFSEVVGVKTYSGEASVGYRLPIGGNQSFTFALAAGASGNDLSSEFFSSNDPALANLVDLNTNLNGRFGILYSIKNLLVGFSLPQIFAQNSFADKQFNDVALSELGNRIYSVSYHQDLGASEIALKPYVVYKELESFKDQYEAGAIAYYQDKFWLGGSYHSNNGPIAFFGVKVKNIASVSYSYEFGSNELNAVSNGSHEIHLALNLGKRRKKIVENKEVEIPDTNVAQTEKEEIAEELYPIVDDETEENLAKKQTPSKKAAKTGIEGPVGEKKDQKVNENGKNEIQPSTGKLKEEVDKPANTDIAKTEKEENGVPIRNQEVADKPSQQPNRGDDGANEDKSTLEFNKKESSEPVDTNDGPLRSRSSLKKGSYVVIGVFEKLANAIKVMKKSKQLGYTASRIMNPENNFHYVYIHYSANVDQASSYKDRLTDTFEGVWVFTVE